MSIIREQEEKIEFLMKAYKLAKEYSPSSPLSVSIKPKEFGKSIGFDEDTTTRIMLELVSERLVTSSLGMGMLMVTQSGLNYLRRLEYSKFRTSNKDFNVNVGNNSTVQIQQGNTNSNQTIMKQSEKLDLLLKGLYEFRHDGKYHSATEIFNSYGVEVNFDEVFALGKNLERDGLIKFLGGPMDISACLTTDGIIYVEEDSYSKRGSSVITNNYSLSIVNSPNANLVNQSNNVTINQNTKEALQTVEKIREQIQLETAINSELSSEILECLNEISEQLKTGGKAKFAIKSLIDIGSGISSIASWLTMLGQFAGIIPAI